MLVVHPPAPGAAAGLHLPHAIGHKLLQPAVMRQGGLPNVLGVAVLLQLNLPPPAGLQASHAGP
jgi:hypothetical protein